MSDLVGNPEDRFSHDAAHMQMAYSSRVGLNRKVQCLNQIPSRLCP